MSLKLEWNNGIKSTIILKVIYHGNINTKIIEVINIKQIILFICIRIYSMILNDLINALSMIIQ